MPDPLLQFSMLQGIDGKKDQRILPAGTLVTAQNVVFDRAGAIEKRPGNLSQGDAVVAPSNASIYSSPLVPSTIPAMTSPGGLFALGSASGTEEVVCNGSRIYCYSPTLAEFISKDELPEAVGTRRSLSSSLNSQVYCADVCQTANGYRVYAWMDASTNANVWVRIYDATTGALVWRANQQVFTATATALRVTAVGNYAVVTITSSTPNIIECLLFVPGAAPSAVFPGTYFSASMNATYQTFDACSNAAGTAVILGYQQAGAGMILNEVAVPAMTSSLTAVPSASSLYTTIKAIAVCDNAGSIWAACTNGITGVVNVYIAPDTTPGSPSSTYAISTVLPAGTGIGTLAIAPFNSTECVLAASQISALGMYAQLLSTTAVVGGATSCPGNSWQGIAGFTFGNNLLSVVSKPMVYNGRAYALVYYPSATQGTYFWCDLEVAPTVATYGNQTRAVAVVAPRLATSIVLNPFTIANTVTDGAGNLWAPCSVLEGGGSTSRQGGALVPSNRLWETRLNFTHPARYLGGPIGKSYAVGSCIYDGVSVTELGFYTYAEGFTGTATTGGALNAGGAAVSYQYMVIFEWTSSSGEIIRSTACDASGSQALSVALSATQNAVNLHFYAPPLTAKVDPENVYNAPVMSIYRTAEDGTTFNFVTSIQLTTGTGPKFVYQDVASDASIATNPELYFTPGFPGTVLDYVCPPSSSHTITTQSRIWLIGDDLRTVWFSNAYQEGIQPQFNEALTLTIQDAGDLTALGYVDDKIVFFSAGFIYYTYGAGPSPTGSGDFYPAPVRVTSDVGCIDPRSVVTIPDGILFLSAKGWCVLGRDLSVTFLTAPFDVMTTYPNVTSAVLYPNRSEVRIALNNGTNGVELILSYWAPTGEGSAYSYRWSWASKYDPVANFPTGGIVEGPGCMSYGAAVVNGAYCWISAAGNPYQEDTSGTNYLDCVTVGSATAANWVTYWIETSWFNANGPIGWQRAKRVSLIGDWQTAHDLYLGVATNFVESYTSSSGTFGPLPQGQTSHFVSTVNDSAAWEQARTVVMNQKNQAIRFSVRDAAPTGSGDVIGSGRGFSLAAIGMTYQPKAGVGKLLASGKQG